MTPSWCPPPENPSTLPTDAVLGQVGSFTVRELCARGMQGTLVLGFILELCRRQFSQPWTVGEQVIRNKLWKPDRPDGDPHPECKILIESIHRWVKQVERRPAIVVKPQGETYENLGIDDYMGTDERMQDQFGCRWVGSTTVFAIDTTGDGAILLGQEVKQLLVDYSPLARSKLGMRAFFVAKMDAPFEIEEAQEAWAVPINCGWAYDYGWKLLKESPILREVRLTPGVLLGF